MKKKILITLSIVAALAATIPAVILNMKNKPDKDLIACLSFDEGAGTTIHDSCSNLPDTEVNYAFSHAVYTEKMDPEWRTGISDTCLLFDGNSTYIRYNKNDITISGKSLTISVWVAPRAFEWDDPNAADNGTDSLTGIISQSDKSSNRGFILGYQRYGRLSFQVGTGSEWLTVWSNGDNLQKYEWNLVTATFDSDSGEMSLYLNGELVASRSVPVNAEIAPATGRSLYIGRNGESERLTAGFINVCSGYMDELKIYSSALSSSQIASYYKRCTVPDIVFSEIWLQDILTTDNTRTQYHAEPYQYWMNEPHAPVYYNGVYHLFFQENMLGSYWRNICWGHFVSTDLASWTPVKEAIVATEYSVVPDGVWSGCATYDSNGIPLLFFTAGNDSFISDGLISNQNIGVAYPENLTDPNLIEWEIYDELAVKQKKGEGRTGEFRDPSIWKSDDGWYMFICSGSTSTKGGCVLLYYTDVLELCTDGTINMNWQYKGVVYEMKSPSPLYGTSWELPIVLPVSNSQGTVTKFMFVFSPAPASSADNKVYYFLGDFDKTTGRFVPDASFNDTPSLFDYGCNVFTGPSAFIDPISGNIIMFSIMQDQRSASEQGVSGWAHCAGLARVVTLSDDGSDLNIAPYEGLDLLNSKTLISAENLNLEEANSLLESVHSEQLRIKLKISTKDISEFGINVKSDGKWDCTTFTCSLQSSRIIGETMNKGKEASTSYVSGSFYFDNDDMLIDIFIDHSLIEAFFDNRKSITMRAYPESADSTAINLFGTGNVNIKSLYVYELSKH